MLADALAPVLSPSALSRRPIRKLGISFSKETLLKKANNVKQKVRGEGGSAGVFTEASVSRV